MDKDFVLKVREHCPRIDIFLTANLPNVSRAQIEKWIKSGYVFCNDKPVERKSQEVFPADHIALHIHPEEKAAAEQPPPQPLQRLYEDATLVIIDKPAGLAVHPGAGAYKETVLAAFLHYYPEVRALPEQDRPGIVHRLDQDTSGVLVLARTDQARQHLQSQFQKRTVAKTYLALIWGKMRFRSGTIITPLVRSQRHRTRFEVFRGEESGSAREAITEYAVVLELDDISLVRLFPKTGRTHQLRVQMAHLKTPVLGDSIYGHGRKSELPRLALHAYAIAFDHPETGNRLTTVCPLPADMRHFIISQKLLARKSPI